MKKFFLLAFGFALAHICASAEPMPQKNILFLSNNPENMVQNAILNGSREALKDLSTRYNTEFSVKNITPITAEYSGVKNQADILLKDLSSPENIGAIVIPNLSNNEKLIEAIDTLDAKKKPIALVSTDLPQSKRIFFVESNSDIIVKEIFNEIEGFLKEPNFKLIVVYSGKTEQFNAPEPIPSRNSQKEMIDSLKGKPYVIYASSVYFSEFTKKFKHDLDTLDNYGILFLDASPLINSVSIAPDGDRDFIIVMSLRPHLSQYLREKEISMCIGGDYFGYGYLSTIAIIEKHFEGKNPLKASRVLMPIKYKVYQTSEFDNDWNSVFK